MVRPFPNTLRGNAEEELDRFEIYEVQETIDHSYWFAPIIVVPKKDGKTQICGDSKVNVNPVFEVQRYPLP